MLDKIVDYKKLELESVRRKISLRDIRLKARDAEPSRSFFGRFDGGISVIAEAKKASPSQGVIRENFDPVGIALDYADHGAKAISVLTDEKFFQGSLQNLISIRKRFSDPDVNAVPLLRKDFTLDEYHVHEARAAGADAVLLIVAILDAFQLKDYRQIAEESGMSVIVEVHNAKEAELALLSGAQVVGINNRDLKTFKVDVAVTEKVMRFIEDSLKTFIPPKERPRLISESGLKEAATIRDLHAKGCDGFLIGESFMREKNPGAALSKIIFESSQK